MRRSVWKIVLALAIQATVCFAAQQIDAQEAQAAADLAVSYEYPGASLPLLVAVEQGYFKEVNLNVKLIKLERSPNISLSSFDVINGHGFYVLNQGESNPSLIRFIHPYGYTKSGPAVRELVVKKSAGISSWQDFKKKGVVISSMYDATILKTIFENNGLTVYGETADITGFMAGGGAIAAFNDDSQAHALYGWVSMTKKLMEDHPGTYEVFASNLECEIVSDPYYQGCSYINMASLRQNPKAYELYIKAIDRAIEYLRQNPEIGPAILAKYFNMDEQKAGQVERYHFNLSTEVPDSKVLQESAENKQAGKYYLATN